MSVWVRTGEEGFSFWVVMVAVCWWLVVALMVVVGGVRYKYLRWIGLECYPVRLLTVIYMYA
jgi:hypothetical protein